MTLRTYFQPFYWYQYNPFTDISTTAVLFPYPEVISNPIVQPTSPQYPQRCGCWPQSPWRICNKKDQNPFGDDDDQFNDLTFSQNSENLTEIQNEIEQDIDEFLNCMKNSIFYGSRIQRFYFSELDKFKNRFIDLEKLKGRWRYYFEIYMKKKDTQIMIPGPKLANELRQREKILIYINEITKICSSLGIQYD